MKLRRCIFYFILLSFLCAMTTKSESAPGGTSPPPPVSVPNVMLRVVRVTPDWMPFASASGWTQAVLLKESEVLKYYEVAIWEETSSVHLYELPNDYDGSYGLSPDEKKTGEQMSAYREQFLIRKYTDMPDAWTVERSLFLKSTFMDIVLYLVNQDPSSEHHLAYSGHGGPGGRLFAGQLNPDHADAFLSFWSESLGKLLGVIDMGGPCNKAGFEDLHIFSKYARYYVASDLPNGGYTMDDWTIEKIHETNPDHQYHNLFAANPNLEDVLIGRIDLIRKAYEYSRNNMISNQVAQANYLYSCEAFRRFSPNFIAFYDRVGVDYPVGADLYQYMIDNGAPQALIEQFNDVIVHKADNPDFFQWDEPRNGILMPHPKHLKSIITAAQIPEIIISEIMVASNDGRLPQWIELCNLSNTDEINLEGWKLDIQNQQSADFNGKLNVTINFKKRIIEPKDTLLIISKRGRFSNTISKEQVYDINVLHGLKGKILSEKGFHLKLTQSDKLIDEVGNINSSANAEDKLVWVLPKSVTKDGIRTSMIRRYNDDVSRLGTDAAEWISAKNTKLLTRTTSYYGHPNDIGAPGVGSGGALPVTLSHFRAEHSATGVILKWTTESEVDNAGFYIYRSETKDGEFKVVNAELIQGAGTTGERNEYTWTDTTAKLNTVYYYRIEDVSHAGVREQLATVRLRGLVSASGKLITRWGDFKLQD